MKMDKINTRDHTFFTEVNTFSSHEYILVIQNHQDRNRQGKEKKEERSMIEVMLEIEG